MRLVAFILICWVGLSVAGYVCLELMAWWYSRPRGRRTVRAK